MSERLVDIWPGAMLVTTRGLGRLAHYRILRHRPAINAGLDFIGQSKSEDGEAGMTTSPNYPVNASATQHLGSRDSDRQSTPGGSRGGHVPCPRS